MESFMRPKVIGALVIGVLVLYFLGSIIWNAFWLLAKIFFVVAVIFFAWYFLKGRVK